jgi:hypothetical protein
MATPKKKAKTTRKIPIKTRQAAKKPIEKPRKTEKKSEITATGIDFCGVKLSALRRSFIVNYVTPGQPCFHNALQSALKAGYKMATAKTDIYEILQSPDIQRIIQKNENMAFRALHASAMRALELKQRQAFYDPLDFFERKEISIKNKNGVEYTKSAMELKPLEDMTPEQRMCIDGIDIKGQDSIPVYLMADRKKELDDIIKIDRELSRAVADTGEEETREIIMERITIRETKRAQLPSDIEYEIVDRPEKVIEGVNV